MKQMNLRKLFLATLLASGAGLVVACGSGEASMATGIAATTGAPLPVEVVAPMKTAIQATYHTAATIAADADAAVLSRVEGEVIEILVEEGDAVAAGQALARVDGERLRLELVKAKVQLQKAQRERSRLVGLHERGLVSAASYEGMSFDVQALRAAYELIRLQHSYTSIRAPIPGIVAVREIKLGQHLTVNDKTFRITDSNRLLAHLGIPQSELAKIKPGQDIGIRVDAMPEQVFVAKIARISPTIDIRNGTFRATAIIANESGLLVPGMFGRFDIAYETHEDALTLPAAAVIEEDGQTVVYIVDKGAASRRVIETGIRNRDLVEILHGIDEDDLIIVSGQTGLQDGSLVLANLPTGMPVTG